MKKLKYLVVSSLVAMGLGSCEQNEMPVYDANYTALNIWFGGTGTVLDSTSYNYSYAMGEKALNFYARISGVPVDYDRTFEIEVYDGDIQEAEGSFRTETYTIKAGEISATCPIYFNTQLLKNEKSFTEEDGDGHLSFRLVESKEFVKGTDKMSSLVVVLKNYLSEPEDWYNAIYPNQNYYHPSYAAWNYFGEYSKVKYQFMIDQLGLVDFHISAAATADYDEATNTISTAYASYLKQKLQIALEEYNSNPNNPDTPLKDENGNFVTF